MKVAGRKTSSAYELYGFIPKVDNGKHSAICMSCNRVLQNTAAIRLQKHRNSCVANRATSGDQAHFPNVENKRRISKPERVQQIDSISSNVKTELSNIEFDDDKFNDNANDNSYGDTVENFQNCISSNNSATEKDRADEKLKAKIQYLKTKSKYFLSEINNLKFNKTMMILKVKKLRLEIKQLEVDN